MPTDSEESRYVPETSEMRWCSRSSDGIGFVTANIYFCFFDHDISDELRDMDIKDQIEDIEIYFIPDGINKDEKWRRVGNVGVAFWTGIHKMYMVVYINDAGTILYMETMGD